MNEAEEIMEILRGAGYEAVDLTGAPPPEPLIDIKEAIKDAPVHWP